MLAKLITAIRDLYSLERRSGRWEWAVLLLFSALIPLVGIPATIRRLHDMGRSGWWLLPFLALPVMLLATWLPIRYFGQHPETWKVAMSVPTVVALVATLATLGWMAASRSAPANRWGEPAERDVAGNA